MKIATPKTLQDAIAYFSHPQLTHEYAVAMRWPDGKVTCPRCGFDKHSFISTRKLWYCKGCKKQFTVKVGTIFEDSAIGMDKWMIAVWMMVNCKNGISSYEIARDLGITQKSAWFMMHRIRLALHRKSFTEKLGGSGREVEADETFTARGTGDKIAVIGILERGGEVRTAVVPTRRKRDLQANIRAHVAAKSALYTDALMSYDDLTRQYGHKVIDHAERYVDGQVHTNGLENFWSLLKRGISGTYVSVEPFHLFRYLDEQTFRYNNRDALNDGERFHRAMQHVANRRLTYAELTGKGTDSIHHEEAGTRPS